MKNSILTLFIVGFIFACGEPEPSGDLQTNTHSTPTLTKKPAILFLGTSLTAAYGLDLDQGWTSIIERRLDSLGYDYEVIHGGVSGETTSGLLSRLDWMLQKKNIQIIQIESGANDGLRGTDLSATESNLNAIIDRIRQYDPEVKILLAGMMMPPNMGPDYTRDFRKIYPRVAKEKNVKLIPFFLEGVGGDRDLNLPDGIHPNVEGQKIVAETVWKYLKTELSDSNEEPLTRIAE